MSWRTLSLLIALIALVAAIILLISRLISSHSGAVFGPARRLVEPVIKDISAERGWQSTSILLESGEVFHLQFLAGEIRDGEAIIRGPSGTGYVVGIALAVSPCRKRSAMPWLDGWEITSS